MMSDSPVTANNVQPIIVGEEVALEQVIMDLIKAKGAISFHDYMEMALYYPGAGYYCSGKYRQGAKGDYYTSVTFTNIFACMIARQMEEMWVLLGDEPFTIVEYGGGNGALCKDILLHLQKNELMYSKLRYYIVEKDIFFRKKTDNLPEGKVRWVSSAAEIPPINGCILSNELLDNFPVHRVVMKEELMEVHVDYDNGFVECLKPASIALSEYLQEQHIKLPAICCTEINIQALSWVEEVAGLLNRGFVLTVDYGFRAEALYIEKRQAGTLMCYHQHQTNTDLYSRIGEQDITAHVNFTALAHWGYKHGLFCCGYTSQRRFLHCLGIGNYLRRLEKEGSLDHLSPNQRLSLINTFMMDMGDKFKVLIQHKDMPEARLSGMMFSEWIL